MDASNNELESNYVSVVGKRKGRGITRPVDRPGIANCIYPDRYGIGHYADEEVFQGLTAAAAWSCLRKSWKGYKIAAGKMDEELKVMYAQRIVGLCRLLDLDEPEFLELYAWPTWHEVEGGVWVPSYYQHGYVYPDGASLGYSYNSNNYYNYWNSQNLYRWY
jgi:hypothetical protein